MVSLLTWCHDIKGAGYKGLGMEDGSGPCLGSGVEKQAEKTNSQVLEKIYLMIFLKYC